MTPSLASDAPTRRPAPRPAALAHWDRLRQQENSRRAREGHLTTHPAFGALMACSGQDESWVCWLLSPEASGVTPLMKASMVGENECLLLLLPYESPDARDSRGMTALMCAAERGNTKACQALADLSPLAARGLHGLDALGLAQGRPCAEPILSAMARLERARIEPAALDAPSADAARHRSRL